MNRQFEAWLRDYDDASWSSMLTELLPSIHEVDRAAVEVWFAFFPLPLCDALANAEDPELLARKLLLQGRYRLIDQVDTSHSFLYGHRFWPHVKKTVAARARREEVASSLIGIVNEVAANVSVAAGVELALTLGISAVGLMTLRQVGLASFESCQSEAWPSGLLARSPEEIIRERARQRGQGPFGFLRTVDRRFDVRYDETGGGRRFRAIENQYLTAASANVETTREDPRCTEGPIPVQCRTAACGTCWVGVLAGESRLSPVDDREWRKMKEFGYLDSDEPHPRIRLACQARVRGCVTIVIPPWNGFFGSLRERAGAATRAQQ